MGQRREGNLGTGWLLVAVGLLWRLGLQTTYYISVILHTVLHIPLPYCSDEEKRKASGRALAMSTPEMQQVLARRTSSVGTHTAFVRAVLPKGTVSRGKLLYLLCPAPHSTRVLCCGSLPGYLLVF